MQRSAWIFFVVLFCAQQTFGQQGEGEFVSDFVSKFGQELWQLGHLVTKFVEVNSHYKSNNARVVTNDGRNLTGQIVNNVGRLVAARTRSIKCIQKKAEELISYSNRADFYGNFSLEYYSMLYSGKNTDDLGWKFNNWTSYTYLPLKKDRQFYSIPVSFESSGVHIPTNLYDRYPDVAESITWTEKLEDVFLNNYNSDPEMSWQYYGAASGMMRLYPAMKWNEKDVMYDCRTRDWFIEAATCSKDVVILMDNSGSTTGMPNTIAKLVVSSLLPTFSNNDFINVLNFSWTATPVDPCFQGLVQANEQNIKHLQEAVANVGPQGNSSVPNAFEAAFKLLKEAREARGCDNSSECQQLIMLVTDGLPGNVTEVFLKHNRLPDGSPGPVRVFTYLLGLQVQGVLELQDMACSNRGYYVHITAMDQVQDKVLKYIPVIARPLALQAEEHPIRWSHLFADVDDPKVKYQLDEAKDEPPQRDRLAIHERFVKSQYFSQQRQDDFYVTRVDQVIGEEDLDTTYKEYRMMTSVSIPVFDNREHASNHSQFPELLAGVAGADVPIRDLYRLTYPYKIGANGYAFIITNNGHLILHPDHRPVSMGILTEGYSSVDLSDVEFPADPEGEEMLQKLRDEMVENIDGDVQNVMIKFHYDSMRRIGVEKRDYYYSPLPGTPFSLGLAIPSDYGDYQIGVKDVISDRLNVYPVHNTGGKPMEAFFNDTEWRVHPDWTYCKYKRTSKYFDTKEKELKDILDKFDSHYFWMTKLREWKSDDASDRDTENCDLPEVEPESYYCDPDLITLLIFDAMVTTKSFQEPVTVRPNESYKQKLLENYNTTLRFVSTQSGLTRWQKIPKPEGDEDKGDFGDIFPRAINEPWFIASVLQYNLDTGGEYNKDGTSYVFSVPFDAGEKEEEEINVMASIAIFPRDGGRKAPASVVGYQLTYQSFYDRFMVLASTYAIDCKSDNRTCYIIDHNAYIVMSNTRKEVGRAFQLVQPNVMQQLLDAGIFYAINITNYQALTITKVPAGGNAASLMDMPWMVATRVLSWFWTNIAWVAIQQLGLSLHVHTAPPIIEEDDEDEEDDDADTVDYTDEEHLRRKNIPKTVETQTNETGELWVRVAAPALQEHIFFLLEPSLPIYVRPDDSSSLITARRIEHTNLMLIVVDRLVKDASMNGTMKRLVEEKNASPCERYQRSANLTRRSLSNCTACHPAEEEIDACGHASYVKTSCIIFLIFPIYHLLFSS